MTLYRYDSPEEDAPVFFENQTELMTYLAQEGRLSLADEVKS